MLSVNPDPVLVERKLVSGELCCPDCGRRLAPWGHAATRFVREVAESVRQIRPRRAICSGAGGCGRTHVLLPRFCLGRRVDVVAVIWAALLARAAGRGWRGSARRRGVRPRRCGAGCRGSPRMPSRSGSGSRGWSTLPRPEGIWIVWPRPPTGSPTRSRRSAPGARRCAVQWVRPCSRCRRRRWWRRVRVAGCWGRDHRRRVWG